MRIAYLSPLPPMRSGVSEYSADLLGRLGGLLGPRIFAPSGAAPRVAGMTVEELADFDRGEFDLAIYHMGNNVHHRFVYQRAMRRPGLVVLHDLVLHHFHVEETLALGRPRDYVELMARTYGDAGRVVAEARADDAASELSYFCFPLFETLAAASRGVLVHNRRAARMVEERVARVPVRVVAMGVPDARQDPLPERSEARRALGIEAGAFVVAIFGFTTPIKRPQVVLEAFAAARSRIAPAELVVIGEVSAALDLAATARELGVGDRVRLTGYLDYGEVKRWVAAADVFVNLRYPTAGETSASLLRLLGWGKVVIVSDYAQFREIPADVAVRVPLGGWELEELCEVLVELRARPELAAAFGCRAQRFVQENHTLEQAARGYADFVAELLERPVESQGTVRPYRVSVTSRTPGRPRAAIEIDPLPARLPPGARLRIPASLHNTGDTVWLRGPFAEGGYAVFGGYLRLATGEPLGELRWTGLPRDVAPGERVELVWSFEIPEVEGEFELVADVKIAGWGWLHWRGSEAAMFRIEISGQG